MSQVAGLHPAVFLDRDGTLIEDRGHLAEPSEVAFYPDAMEALKRLQERFLLFLVTNQSGVARGLITLEDVNRVNARVVSHVAGHGITITDVYVCPHQRSDGCSCIKPNPRFLYQAAAEHGVDLQRSFTIGDHPHDVELARAAGARGIYVRTGHGSKHLAELRASEIVVAGIGEAADWILASTVGQG
jgi:histidinol-phosphate phosphatase family protein